MLISLQRSQPIDDILWGCACVIHQREPVLLKELGRVKHPDRVFHYSCQIWFPQRWVVTRHYSGEDEDIATVLADTPINQTADAGHVPGPDEVT